ncbi:MAG: protein phosphatase 2C domain-containing protein, partial [Chloroflexota bacterium]
MQNRFPQTFENITEYEPIEPMQIQFGYSVIQGGRQNTEDYADVQALTTRGFLPLTVGIVADGVGGNVFGEEAAKETVETALRYIQASPLSDPNGIPTLLEFALIEANRRVIQRSRTEREKLGMASTAIVAAIYENLLFIANVGDSRAYIVKPDALVQLSLDHSW